MSLSVLPLSYCTNVHPGRSVADVELGLREYTAPLQRGFGSPLAAGLWLAEPVIRELLAETGGVERFADHLRGHQLACYTLNAFPYGDFHSTRVKENVYVPDWSQSSRREYTLNCARILAKLLPHGVDGSISTVPLGFKEFAHPVDFLDRCADQLIDTACELERLHENTGSLIRLAIEPEPFCVLETTPETIAFFARLRSRGEDRQAGEAVRRHIGVCYDVCHQSVEFEDVAASIGTLDAAEIRINKVHITCAIELDRPADREAREALARYVEPRYLHQTMARCADGRILRVVDLTGPLALDPPTEFRDAKTWRVHFHVPVNAESLGPLRTTRPDLKRALQTVAELDYAPHLEVETYTWEVLPDGPATDLVDGLTRELTATRALLAEFAGRRE